MLLIGAGITGLGVAVGKSRRVCVRKKTAFECGFDKMRGSRVPFSLQFYHLGLLFLIFDLEMVLFIPVVIGLNVFRGFAMSGVLLAIVIFIFVLLLGLGHEYREGTLN